MRRVVQLTLLLIWLSGMARAQSAALETTSLSGESLSLDSLRRTGPVLLTFWALWCTPCKEELRAIETLYTRYREKGFAVIAINQDSPRSVAKIRAYLSSQGFSFPVVLDPEGRLLERFGGQAIPFTLLFDKSGNVSHRALGYLPGDEKKLEKEIVKALASR